jgi:hypothetical protein
VFDHAIVKLKVAQVAKLIVAPGLAAVLNDLKISIILFQSLRFLYCAVLGAPSAIRHFSGLQRK